jgi:hypothetical protein
MRGGPRSEDATTVIRLARISGCSSTPCSSRGGARTRGPRCTTPPVCRHLHQALAVRPAGACGGLSAVAGDAPPRRLSVCDLVSDRPQLRPRRSGQALSSAAPRAAHRAQTRACSGQWTSGGGLVQAHPRRFRSRPADGVAISTRRRGRTAGLRRALSLSRAA